MPAPEGDASTDATALARRYLRLERSISGLVALMAAGLAGAAIFLLPLLVGLLVSVGILSLLRIPVFQTGGVTRLSSAADSKAVIDAFEGPKPPILVFQWGVADSVQSTADGMVYDIPYLFGLRSAQAETTVRSTATADNESSADIELDITENGEPWGSYSVSIRESETGTLVDIEWESDRRFGLRRLPQWAIVRRYRDGALAALGYRVVEREASLSL